MADRVWRKGEQRGFPRGGPVLEEANRWSVRSTLSRVDPLEEHVANLLGILTPDVDEIRAQSDDHSVTFACVISAGSEEDYAQQAVLSGEQVALIGAMGANFWADVYFLAGD